MVQLRALQLLTPGLPQRLLASEEHEIKAWPPRVAGAAGQEGVDLVEHGPAGSHLLVRAHSHPTM